MRFGVVTSRAVAGEISLREDQRVYLHRRFNHSLVSTHTLTGTPCCRGDQTYPPLPPRHFSSYPPIPSWVQVFPRSERNFTPEALSSWVSENAERTITWLHLPGEKSSALEAELLKGPALLVFLPASPFAAGGPVSEVSPACDLSRL